MKDHAQVVIIGGGIVGCSVLYHLATLGWQDILLIEQDELSAGSTWHAAGSFSRFDMLPNLIRLRDDSLRLYDQLATAGEHPFEIHRTGGMILATDEQRLQELKLRTGLGRSLGMPHVLLSRHEVSAHHPLTDTTGIVGGLYDPLAGHVDPAGLTHALAQGAMKHGGSISERTKVIAMSEEADGSWLLVTDQGEVLADVVVNAAGLWAGAVADMIGVDVPIAMIEHQYMATDKIDEVQNIDGELPSLCAPDDSYQLRHDRHGLLLRAFDDEASSWTLEQIQPDFGKTLLDGSPERLAQAIGDAAKRVPCLDGATFKPAVNGPLTVSPDGRPLLGPLPGFSNYFLACGFMDGLSLAGGAGKALAEWIVEGEPPLDLFALDATRFGDFARQSYTVATARDAYRRYYAIRFPKDHSSAGRPLKRAAIYDKLAFKGAQFDAVFGWERPCWYAENNTERLTVGAFNRGPSFDAIGRECRGLRRGVGIADLTTSLAKHVIEGPEAEDALDRLIASRLPARPGSIVDAVMLNRRGKVNGLFTLARIGHHGFYLLGAAEAERYHQRWFEQHLPAEGVIYAPVSVRYAVLGIAGPKARILLTRVTDEDVSDKMLPADTTTEIEIAGAPAQVMRVSFTGDLGYQIHLPMEYQATVYEALYVAGQDLGLVNAGAFALKSLRLEAGFHRFPGDHAADLAPREAGLDELIQGNKGGFIGCDAMMKRRNEDALRKCVLIEIEADDADAIGGEPVYRNNKLIGSVIAGDYGHHAQMSLARAVVPVDFAAPGTVLAIDILGNRHPATVRQHPPFGPGDLPLSI